MSIFKELLAIKSFREGQAEAQMRTQRAVALEAVQQTEAARDLLARLMEEGQREEAAMYARLCAQVVKLRDIEDVRGEVAQLRNADNMRVLLKELLHMYVEYDIINLSDESFDDFIDFCNVPETTLKDLSQYEFLVYVKKKYELYTSVGPTRRH